MMKSRLQRLEDKARETDRLETVFIGTEPTSEQLAILARRNQAAFIMPDNRRSPGERTHDAESTPSSP